MKKLIFIILCFGSIYARAQSGTAMMLASAPSGNYNHEVQPKKAKNDLSRVDMAIQDNKIILYNIPKNKKHVWGVVTNMDGEWVKTANLSAEKNEIDIHKLHRPVYFLTLMYKNERKKAFVIHPDVTKENMK